MPEPCCLRAAVFLEGGGTICEQVGYLSRVSGFPMFPFVPGYGEGELAWQAGKWPARPDFVADDLTQAVDWIVRQPR